MADTAQRIGLLEVQQVGEAHMLRLTALSITLHLMSYLQRKTQRIALHQTYGDAASR
jgi:hypothetical protein